MYADATSTSTAPAGVSGTDPHWMLAPDGWVYSVYVFNGTPAVVSAAWSPDGKADPAKVIQPPEGERLYAGLLRIGVRFNTLAEAIAASAMAHGASPSAAAGVPAKTATKAPAKKGQQRRVVQPKKTSPWVYVGVGAGALAFLGLIIYISRRD